MLRDPDSIMVGGYGVNAGEKIRSQLWWETPLPTSITYTTNYIKINKGKF